MKKFYRKLLIASLLLVYLVILAGAVVRMTGSGMGCPDWPKCFGYYIPPTEESVLIWQPGRTFEKGQMIMHDEALWSATANFTSGDNLDLNNFEKYTKHDYAIFNPSHTWTEYINRLAGALAGLAVLLTAILSFFYWKESKRTVVLSWLLVFMMGFQAWLGAKVVYSVLVPYKISIHMLMALLIVAFQIYLLTLHRKVNDFIQITTQVKFVSLLALLLLLVQVLLGVSVRQAVDEQVRLSGYDDKSLWASALQNIGFYVHRSFSFLILIINGWLYLHFRKLGAIPRSLYGVLTMIFLEIFLGILIAYFDFPFLTQPLHLVIASVLFGFQSSLWLQSIQPKMGFYSQK
ncbi:MAG: COX15/CtaA family protein [Flavobacteriaceae bacterium]|nr:COX15/CtaA family protein [Flavobacteriaceae bacterium]